jgi:hypothetical protein
MTDVSYAKALLSRLVSLVQRDGREATLHGVLLLNGESGFVLGNLAKAACYLYCEATDGEKEERRDMLFSVLEMAAEEPCYTWGKLLLLSVLTALKERGELSLLGKALLEKLRLATDVSDFYDKQTRMLKGRAANYLHVAAECLAMREKLGWDTREDALAATVRLKETACTADGLGFLDDQPPEGRFDSYTFMVTTHLPDQCKEAKIPLPESALGNLRLAAEAILHMANRRGDGFVYGRSLSVYGDTAPLGVLRCALKHGLLSPEEKRLAADYVYAILDKLERVWYDKELGVYNIWFGGRGTDGYRERHRLLQLNVEIAQIVLETYAFWVAEGLPPREDTALPAPEEWEAHTVIFSEKEEQKAAAVILRRRDLLAMLPFVGAGGLSLFPAYLPFPATGGILEAAPQSNAPYLVPEYEKDGARLRPLKHFTNIRVQNTDGRAEILAEGFLVKALPHPALPEKTEYRFSIRYLLEGDGIQAEFTTDLPYDRARAVWGTPHPDVTFTARGFDEFCPLPDAPKAEIQAPHGAYIAYGEYLSHSPAVLSWCLRLPE